MKTWADEVRRHIETWANQLGSLNWWPRFVYHPSTITPGPFDVSFSYSEMGTEPARSWTGRQTRLNNRLSIQIPGAIWGIATLHLDDALAFTGRVTFKEIPF